MISGDFEIAWPSGNAIKSRAVVYLCRCGQSNDKPFCDGSHKKVGFSSQEGDATAHRE
jgi:CDGSH-type Zn-finger protein